MKFNIGCVCIVIAIVTLLSNSTISRASNDDVANYAQLKDKAVKDLSKIGPGEISKELTVKDEKVREQLTLILSKIIPWSMVAGYIGPGKPNLETLLPELGYGKLDGMTWDKWYEGGTFLFVSTPALVRQWYSTTKQDKSSILAESQSINSIKADDKALFKKLAVIDEFYSTAIESDSRWTTLGEIPTKVPPNFDFLLVTVGQSSQDIPTAQPTDVQVVAQLRGFIFIFRESIVDLDAQINECDTIFKSKWSLSEKLDEQYRATRDQTVFKQILDIQDAASLDAVSCYQQSIGKQSFVPLIQTKVERFISALIVGKN
jgi:hypothetical protein